MPLRSCSRRSHKINIHSIRSAILLGAGSLTDFGNPSSDTAHPSMRYLIASSGGEASLVAEIQEA